MKYCVYAHTHKESGKKYFGITCQTPAARWRKGKGYKGCSYFYNAIIKYGWDAFYHDILISDVDESTAFQLEQKFIKEYKTTDENYGYNIRSGGEHPSISSHSIELIRLKRKGKKVSQIALENIRRAAKERDNSVFSHPRSEDTKRKISESHKGMTYGEETKQKLREAFSQPVLCVELNQVFPSMTEAAHSMGLSKCTISAVIKGRNKTAAGYHWILYNS